MAATQPAEPSIIDAVARDVTPKAPRLLVPDLFKPVSGVRHMWGWNSLVYGVVGSGKTTLIASAQDSDYGRNVYILDIEGGAQSIADRDDVKHYKLESIEMLKPVLDWLEFDQHDVGTFGLDSMSELASMAHKYFDDTLPDKIRSDPRNVYGEANKLVGSATRRLRDISQKRGINIVITSRLREERDDKTGAVLHRGPALTPGAADAVAGIVDAVGYMTITEGDHRRITFAGNPLHLSKYRQPKGWAKLPDRIDDPTMDIIFKHIRSNTTK